MHKLANIYDICDKVILKEEPKSEPGKNLRLLYKRSVCNLLLKTFVLRGCLHPEISIYDVPKYQEIFRSAMQASINDWKDKDWINTTFQPIALLLDKIKNPTWQIREKSTLSKDNPSKQEMERIVQITMEDVFRVWDRDKKDPYFPVAAQVMLSGDDYMNGENFLKVLRGLGSFESQNISMLFSFVRSFIMANPRKLSLIRKPYKGVCEPMSPYKGWIWHRTAYYDSIFFQYLLRLIDLMQLKQDEYLKLIKIMESLINFIVVKSQEQLKAPNSGIKHPAITCLPKGERDVILCRLSKSNWKRKRELGFGDYVPDTDTTFLSLSMARKWLNFVSKSRVDADKSIIENCERFLNHPYVEIINEYQIGSGYSSNPPTIEITKPLDYYGGVPIWFEKSFTKPDGHTIRDIQGNEICPGHNMNILESILTNRKEWNALEGENLKTVHRLLEFHHRAFTSGNFQCESAYKFYLPEIYMYYTGRMYDIYITLNQEEKSIIDPDKKIEEIRRIGIDYCKNGLIGHTLNPFDASLAVSALILLRYESKDDGVIATGLKVMSDALGEGRKGHPFKAYEWNKMRHPTRIIVGSDVSTSFFVMNAFVMAYNFLGRLDW